MTSEPTGRLVQTDRGHDLVLTRSFDAGIEEIWADLTDPGRTARWFGSWRGEAAPGRTVQVQMAYEEGAPWMDMRIEACEQPRRLGLFSTDEAGSWRVELLLAETGGRTGLTFVHHLETLAGLGEVGPGWEYYLDMLAAARDGSPQPAFDDYYQAMKAHYEAAAG